MIALGPISIVNAQINESDTLSIQLRTRATGNYQKGNVNILTTKCYLEFSTKIKEQWVFKSQNVQLYQEISERKADNNLFSRNYLYFKPENIVYPFGIAYISTNFRRKIDLRYFAGAGISYSAVASEKHLLKFALNVVYEISRFDAQFFNVSRYNNSNEINLWRSTFFVAGFNKLLNNRIHFSYEGFFQPAFETWENYRTQISVSLDIPIWNRLYLSADYAYTHENVVPVATKENDTFLTFGIGYEFKSQESK